MHARWLVLSLLLFLASASSVDTAYMHSPTWSYRTEGGVSSVKYDNGKVLIASGDYTLYAVNLAGSLEWRFPMGDEITSICPLSRNITVASMDGLIYMISEKGNTLWSRELPSYVGYDKAVSAGRGILSVGTADGMVYVLDNGGDLIGRYNTGEYVLATEVLDEGIIAISDRQIFLLMDNGSLVKTFELDRYIRTAATTDKYVAVGFTDGTIVLYDTTGMLLWTYDTKDQVGTISLSDEHVSAGTKGKKLLMFDVNGTLMWAQNMTDSVAATDVSEPYLAVSTLDNNVYLYNTDGMLKWGYSTNGRALNLVIDGGYLLSGTNTGLTYLSEIPSKSEMEVVFVSLTVAVIVLLGLLLLVRSILKT